MFCAGAAGQKQKAATVRRATADMDDDDDDIPDLIDDEEPLSSLTHGAHPTQAVPESDASGQPSVFAVFL